MFTGGRSDGGVKYREGAVCTCNIRHAVHGSDDIYEVNFDTIS